MKLWSDIVRCPNFAFCSAAGRLDRCRSCVGPDDDAGVDNFRFVNSAAEVGRVSIPIELGGKSDPGKL